MSEIEINLVLAVDTKAVETNLKDFARSDVAWHKVAVRRIFFFEEVPAFFFRN